MLNGGRKERGAGKSCARWEMNGWEWDTSYPGNAVLFGMVAQTPKGYATHVRKIWTFSCTFTGSYM